MTQATGDRSNNPDPDAECQPSQLKAPEVSPYTDSTTDPRRRHTRRASRAPAAARLAVGRSSGRFQAEPPTGVSAQLQHPGDVPIVPGTNGGIPGRGGVIAALSGFLVGCGMANGRAMIGSVSRRLPQTCGRPVAIGSSGRRSPLWRRQATASRPPSWLHQDEQSSAVRGRLGDGEHIRLDGASGASPAIRRGDGVHRHCYVQPVEGSPPGTDRRPATAHHRGARHSAKYPYDAAFRSRVRSCEKVLQVTLRANEVSLLP